MSSLYSFLDEHSLYVVLIIVLVIWLGIFVYLFWLDGKVNKLYKNSESEEETERNEPRGT